MRPYPLIELPGLKAIEAEKGEVIVNPEKIAFEIGGKSHANGGTKMLAEEGSYILSQHIKLEKDVVSALGFAEKKLSPAALSRLAPTQKFADVVGSKDKRYDDLSKKTAALMFEKNAAKQDLIFTAQEEHKASKGMKNDLTKAKFGMGKLKTKAYQSGGEVPGAEILDSVLLDPNATRVAPWNPNIGFGNAPNFAVTDNTVGYSSVDAGGRKTMTYRPFANDPYFDIQKDLLAGAPKNATQREILGQRQARLSNLRNEFPGAEGEQIEKEYARYIQAADRIEKDQNIDKFLTLSDGKEIPLADATPDQIEMSKGLRFYNKRTGKDDIVDYRDRQNQGFDPVLTYVEQTPALEPLGRRQPAPIARSANARLADLKAASSLPVAQATPQVTKGIDHQSIINGVQMGLAALDLANVRTKPPYYDYQPSEIAYTRYEPVNTKQAERSFNIARQAIENSNLPQQVKTAQLAAMYGQMNNSINEVDLNNYQNKLANDNRNVERFTLSRNQDILREQDANLRYVAEADRRNAQAAQQRQVYLDSIMDTWRTHVANRRDIGLVNQFSRNYDYNFNQEQVGYVPGQGVPGNTNRLQGFAPRGANIDPNLLNAEGLRTYGFNQ